MANPGGLKKILFLCSGNSARSQFGEELLRKFHGDRFEVFSAGTEPAPEIHPLTVRVLKEDYGIDVSGKRTRNAAEFDNQEFDVVVTTCGQAAACPMFPAAVRLHWEFEDPVQAPGDEHERLEAFRRTARGMLEKFSELVNPQD